MKILRAKCKDCGKVLESMYGGDFQGCGCESCSFIDRCRGMDEVIRAGGAIEIISFEDE